MLVPLVPRTLNPLARCTLQRTYASLSTALALSARQVLQLDPAALAAICTSTVSLTTATTWSKWPSASPSPADGEVPHDEDKCAAELPRVLAALDRAPSVTRTSIALDDVLDLPVRHRKREGGDHEHRGRTPVSIMRAVGLRARCRDVGLWRIDEFPSVEVEHAPTRLALAKARAVAGTGDDGGRASWHAFVAARKHELDPDHAVYKAFDWTADFHSRDLDGAAHDASERIDLGVMGNGYWRMQPRSLDDFSVDFAADVDHNAQFFRNADGAHEWQPDMYARFRKEGKSFIDVRLRDRDEEEKQGRERERPASVVLNCEVCELPDDVRERVVAMLRVGEGEEVVVEGKVMRRVKKAGQA
ncbi:hypothetical protein BDV95DRAFT_593670 [Massariosphaeria phaeospora]|uniref:Uncharacterized protein n=1 Tax=Massariosphaeria phaeospora TaxID=100035 RepID=A0A7C8MFT6_9PLEO|nr:hypothetical protein BDV95DRAFT_593670 [Massariosphaeria phaeospora]